MASSSAPEDYDLRLPPVDGMKGTAREQKAVYVRLLPFASKCHTVSSHSGRFP